MELGIFFRQPRISPTILYTFVTFFLPHLVHLFLNFCPALIALTYLYTQQTGRMAVNVCKNVRNVRKGHFPGGGAEA